MCRINCSFLETDLFRYLLNKPNFTAYIKTLSTNFDLKVLVRSIGRLFAAFYRHGIRKKIGGGGC